MKRFLLALTLLSCSYVSYAQQTNLKNPQANLKNPQTGFIENKGQITDQYFQPNHEVKYLLTLDGINVQLKENSFSYDTYVQNEEGVLQFHRVDINLIGANSNPIIMPLLASEDYLNYYTAGTNEEGVTNVKHYREVLYKNIYHGIDLHFKAHSSTDKPVEYDFIIHPGADASQIKMNYIGAFDKKIEDGKIILRLAHGNLSERIPASYIYENQQNIAVNYKNNNGLFEFVIAKYDQSKTLVIDPMPVRDWATYYGGTLNDGFRSITIDASNNIFVTGYTISTTSIATAGAHQTALSGGFDAMIARFNTNGVRSWATYYGGTSDDKGKAIAIDASANIYIVGTTSSSTNIATAGAHQTALAGAEDGFLARFSSAGVRSFGTYFGGNSGADILAIAVSGTSVYFGGSTSSTTGIASPGAYLTTLPVSPGAFMARFNTTGVRQWSSYYQADKVNAVTVDGLGNPIFGGISSIAGAATAGAHQTANAGSSDGFVAKFSAAGARTWATYYGGPSSDYVVALRTNSTNDIIVGGGTSSATGIADNVVPTLANAKGLEDGFIAYLSASGVRQWGMYIGTSTQDVIRDIEIATDNSIYFSGTTNAYIGTPGCFQPNHGGDQDLFFGKIDPLILTNYGTTFSPVLFITNYGGTSTEFYGDISISGSATDRKIFITGRTYSSFSMSTLGSHQHSFGGVSDGMLARFTECGTPGRTGSMTAPAGPFCAGASYTFSVSNAYNASSYEWVLPSGWSGTSSTNSITVIAGSSGGTISVRGVNACGQGLYTSLAVTISPAPSQPGAISGATTVCQGSSQTYSVTPVSGATSYTWTLPSGWSGTSSSNSIPATVGANSGNITVTANACGSSTPRTLAVTVTPVPSQPGTISGNTTVCQGSSQTYSVTPVSGATSYTWTLPSGWSGTSSSNSIPVTVGANSGNITVTANNACGSSTAQTLAVTVSTIPSQPGTISGNTTVCAATYEFYSVTNVPGVTYTWILPSGWSGSSITNSISASVGIASGHIQVLASNSCGSSPVRTLAVTSTNIPAQPSFISGQVGPCQGSVQTYSVTNVAGLTYTWSLPSGWTGSSTSNTINVTVGTSTGTISVTATNACGSSTPRTLAVTVTPIPSQPGTISGSTTVCQGSSQTYSVTPVSGATSYTWTLPSGWSGTSSSNSIPATVGANSGNITVTANNACGSSTAQTLAVTVTPVPSQPGTISGNTTVCQGSSQTYSVTPVSGATSYTWTLPSGWSGTSSSNSIPATVGANSGNITVTANNACGSSTAQTLAVTVTPVPSQPGVISGNTTVCQGSSQTYSVTPVSGATSYTWTLPSGWTGTSSSNSIPATVGANSGNITVTANNACGSSTAQTLAVTVTPVPSQPGVISGSTTVCQGSSQTYSVTPVSGATSYTWTLPSGWSGINTTNSINPTVGANSGNITVTANNACGSSTAQTLAVTVTPVPSQPGAISGATTVCQGSSQTYSVTPVSGATSYTWTLPSGWSGINTTNSINATVGANGGSISVTANNTCGSSTAQSATAVVTNVPNQPSPITGSTTVCSATTQTYSVSNVGGVTYAWNATGGTVSGSGNSVSITWNTAGTQTITVTPSNSCGSGPARTLSVTVNSGTALGQPGPISGATTVCSGTSQTYSVTPVSGATSYTWTLPSGWSGTSSSNSIPATVGANSGNITVTANNACGSSTAQTLAITVNPTPSQPGTISGNTTVCQGSSQTYSVTAVPGATSYTWTLPSGWIGTSSTNSIPVTVGANSGNITVTANNACGSSTAQTIAVTVTTTPSQPGTISGATTVCQGSSQTYSIAAVPGATSYTWTLPSGWSGINTTNSINPTVGANSGNITVTANNACGSSTAQTLAVTVTTTPSQPGTISGNTTVCQGSSQTYSVTPVSGATSYTWTLPSDWSGTSSSNSIPATVGANSGNITVTANNACGNSTAQTLAITVNPTPSQPGVISGSTSVCQGSSQTYSVAAVSGATSYTWTLPSGWSGTSSTNSIPVTVGANSGHITVTANNACGNSTAQTLAITVNPTPSQPGVISGSTSVCQASSQTYSVAAVSGATSYTWTLPSGWSGTSSTNSIPVTVGANSGNITVTANNACGSSNATTLSIVVNPGAPAQPSAIIGDTIVCKNSTQTYSVAAVPDATSYTWTLPNGWTGSSSTNSISPTVGANGGTITVIGINGCGSSPAQTINITVNAIPNVTANASATSVCRGNQVTLTGSGATSYTWDNGVTNGVAFAPLATTTYTVTGTDANGCSNTDQIKVTVNPLPNVSVSNNANTLTVNQAGATYQWIDCNNNNAPISEATNQSFTPTTVGSYAVVVTLNGCVDTSACQTVTFAGVDAAALTKQVFSIYPNPNGGNFTIQSTKGGVFELIDITGKVINTYTITNTQQTVNENIPAGMYFVREKESGTIQKLIVQ
jgi:hypothetical protein